MAIDEEVLEAVQSTIELNQKVTRLIRHFEAMDERLREPDRRIARLQGGRHSTAEHPLQPPQ